ncbi:putative cyclase domain-containing protein [Hirsutella rhossiliensis]|uniref:Cyclase domain-containing protein n=1 Tax=Hirsutella rhossiliensis TaxID=111463 RepID=A0A9P8MXE3_9HYPO|nr:putative cyclase domain-containing protein [Hirsutella rhossiliensis]KAH0962752.1 putative cyclase domain-containing protein [Hirsutella rhossiliensis]
MTLEPSSYPDFDDLPKVEGMPQGCAWGVFDRDGQKDLVGTLNFLTPAVVKAAAAEVKDGVSISLNWPLDGLAKLGIPGRKPPRHTVLYLPDTMPGIPPEASSWDDELDFNTQSSSQWDSLCHVQHLPSGLAYNGLRPDARALAAASTAENDMPTLDHWHARGALAGRGVLLDYAAFARDTGLSFGPFDGTAISVAQLEACARHFAVDFRPGDVLVVRTGATEFVDGLSQQEAARVAHTFPRLSGIEGSPEMARWLWNKRFTAAASDSVALEVFPPINPDGTRAGMENPVLHHYMLGLFGMPIGELWDLGKLSQYCQKTKRYSFMITSAPLNHPCLIASPPNALAIF